jgi:flagellar biosynthesis protein FlhF
MNIRTFVRPDHRQAMQAVREAHGDDATIISTRRVEGGIEITSAQDYDPQLAHSLGIGRARKADAPAAPTAPAAGNPAPAVEHLLGPKTLPVEMRQAFATSSLGYGAPAAPAPGKAAMLVSGITGAVGAAAAGMRQLGSTMARGTAGLTRARRAPASPAAAAPLQLVAGTQTLEPAVHRMRDELGSMRKMIERELGQLSVDRLRSAPSRAAALDLLDNCGFEPSFATAIAGRIDPGLAEEDVLDCVGSLLAGSVPVCETDPLVEGGVIALVGPTGAGKTTTAAKLAALFARKHSTRDVALITTDQHRAAAREQLQAHGRRLGITVLEADGPAALPQVLRQVDAYPLVIVDTAGLSPRDRALVSQLNMIRAAEHVRVMLVLPANSNARDASDLLRAYGGVRPDGIILTKVDETHRLGGAMSVAARNNLPIAYTACGQNVPGDIEPATRDSLAGLLAGATASCAEITEENHDAVA